MKKISKAEAVRIIHDCAVIYDKNLSSKNVLFVSVHNGKAIGFETLFMPHNYKHLTGVKTDLSGDLFFRAAVDNKLGQNNITLMPNGITEQKLSVLSQLLNIHLTARMIGDYDNSRPLLIADKFAGTVTMAMGFTYINGLYIPNTALKMDIREITTKATRRRVVAIFVKPRIDRQYRRLTYIAKDMMIDDELLASIMKEKVDKVNLTADFFIPGKIVEIKK